MSSATTGTPISRRDPPTLGPRRATLLLIAYLGSQILAGLAVGVLGGIFMALEGNSGGRDAALREIVLLGSFCSAVAGGLVVYVFARRSLPGPLASGALRPVGWNRVSSRTLLWAFLFGIALAAFYVLVLVPAAPPVSSQRLGPLASAARLGGWYRLCWAVLLLLVAPPIEEFVFRGVLLTGYCRTWTTGTAGSVVALLFWLMHLPEMQGYTPALVAVALVGGATVVARVTTDSLAPAIALHASYNLGIVVAVYAGAT